MDATTLTYSAYLLISIGLTIWVATTLSRAGRVFLLDVFAGNERLSDAVNHLLVVGFYLINLGFVALYLRLNDSVEGLRGVFEALSIKLGIVLLVLGVMHLGNVFVFNRLRRRSVLDRQFAPPVVPTGWLPQPSQAPGIPQDSPPPAASATS